MSLGSTDILNKLPMLHERFLVLYFISRSPGFNLVSMPLELLNLPLEVVFKLLLLGSIGGLLYLVEDPFECLYTFSDLFESLVNILLKFSLRHNV